MIERLHRSDEDLVGKTVLLVDDDPRNIFALSSILERRGMRVLTAANRARCDKINNSTQDIALVLMDIMMPEMDGYKPSPQFAKTRPSCRLPIIAPTAKAMKGDREKSLEAGASEYRQTGQYRATAFGNA